MLPDISAVKPLAEVLAFRANERAEILAYGKALALERSTYAAVLAWREVYGRARVRMKEASPFDARRLYDALKDAEDEAIDEHEAASTALKELGHPFSVIDGLLARDYV